MALVLGILLLAAGRWSYGPGWAYAGVNLLLLIATAVLLSGRSDLIEERLKPGPGMKGWDRLYFALNTPLFFAMLILAALDAGRFGWSSPLPPAGYAAGWLAYGLGQAVFLWAKRTNRFFATVVRIQTDRGQTVCREGPYRLVRHPGYVGGLLFTLAVPPLLGSLWALVPAAASAALLVWRTAREDLTLRRELPGYAEYAREVRWRLLPGFW